MAWQLLQLMVMALKPVLKTAVSLLSSDFFISGKTLVKKCAADFALLGLRCSPFSIAVLIFSN